METPELSGDLLCLRFSVASFLLLPERGSIDAVETEPIEDETAALLEELSTAEYSIRKYRTRGDARAKQGNHRSAMEYHALAAKELARARESESRLLALHGPDGGPGVVLTGVLELAKRQVRLLHGVDDPESFEDACFHRRHPIWASRVERYQEAHATWTGRSELEDMAPGYHPIYDGWTD